MKTTELYLEQVLIGALVCGIALLPWMPEVWRWLARPDLGAGALALAGSVVVAAAFWLGILFDRLADTLSERLDQHGRLQFALKRNAGRQFPWPGNGDKLDKDLFPEDELKIASLRDAGPVVEWMDYHRARIRLVRALAVYGPGLALALSVGARRFDGVDGLRDAGALCIGAIAIGYVAWVLLARLGTKPPRTNKEKFLTYAREWGAAGAPGAPIQDVGDTGIKVWKKEWRQLTAPTLMLLAALTVGATSGQRLAEVGAVAATALTVLCAWAWWRITQTYRSYLFDLGRFRRP